MNIVTTARAVQMIRAEDPNSVINGDMLRRLFAEKKLPSWKHGKRTVCEFDQLVEGINELLGLEVKKVMPRVRSIHDAFIELRELNPQLGVSEQRMRRLVGLGRLPHIRVGTRAYVALESFEEPYNECLIFDDLIDSEKAIIQRIAQEQADEGMVRRQKRKK